MHQVFERCAAKLAAYGTVESSDICSNVTDVLVYKTRIPKAMRCFKCEPLARRKLDVVEWIAFRRCGHGEVSSENGLCFTVSPQLVKQVSHELSKLRRQSAGAIPSCEVGKGELCAA